jgi:hypothetical protein
MLDSQSIHVEAQSSAAFRVSFDVSSTIYEHFWVEVYYISVSFVIALSARPLLAGTIPYAGLGSTSVCLREVKARESTMTFLFDGVSQSRIRCFRVRAH